MSTGRKIGLGFVFVYFFGGGVCHFLLTDFFVAIVPPWVPWPAAAVYVSGVFEIIGALGILVAVTRRLAGWGLFLLTIAVTPANVHMSLHPDLFPDIPSTALAVRLVLQVFLLALILWSTWQRSDLSDFENRF